ncbi:4-hydroxyphenylpyruvate dioxygenase [Streptomyces sp. NPDC048215]|uniref:4-hydroxyphenylpyruvate dioxygenase n=1 Tax=Streptomyces TaxID=1883 RepID=UPI002E1536B1|nr:4-hydroxyphenylpyruvate dioxygenase [[Kitasatospora] papulosa]WSK27607.1 4-hydroxyphenylpyruvate dioxygenase [[Kitasatospora] papulosa]
MNAPSLTSTSSGTTNCLQDLRLDYVELYVECLDDQVTHWTDRYGFVVVGTAGSPDEGFRSAALRQGRITLVVTQGTRDEHPASLYVSRHGDGVADIALQTEDVVASFAEVVGRGARSVAKPARHNAAGVVATATVAAFGDIVHTFVQRAGDATPGLPIGFHPVEQADSTAVGLGDEARLLEIDHFAVCVEIDELDPTVVFYTQALGFTEIFEERIAVGTQAMLSKVVQSPSRDITFTIIQPDPIAEPGQIDEFLKNHKGPGIQHVAFASYNAACSVRALSSHGVSFLQTPAAYYEMLADRVDLQHHTLAELSELNILVDEDHGGQLFQIFTRSTHPRRTLFFEVIERLGAETFGSSNIKALYEAVELERQRESGRSAR